jgi:tellurite resistance protein TerC
MHWVIFNISIVILIFLDLFVFHRKREKDTLTKALLWSGFWIVLALSFNLYIIYWKGSGPGLEFFTGYLIEKSLSVDNLFVMASIFAFYKIPLKDQHTILYWGILGALVMRLLFILGGIALIERFHWLIYILGVFLVYTGVKLVFQKKQDIDPKKNLILRWIRKHLPQVSTFFLALITIEYTDLIFALDSLPAIFAVTNDSFIIYTSNAFAILGLRSLYFVLAAFLNKFKYLKYGLAAILVFVGLKMTLSSIVIIPLPIALGVIALCLGISIYFSVRKSQ